ncbi:MAG: hypothetical protein A2X19_03815 [Bacteroidetes bacterium GWE2_39_28]|nr:MAG: hypothetical protein A2X19_03815 [Bacteroidetes bacterium GWE2_39_28]OFY14859.1 MAG: hypothetical protein A2X16_09730 [Bacteroidetes bacterium GWF2_39_10]OFZ09045.1 MAG: hypothetical protein A2322_05670 [Bacteroidetes bacterium RIFOXYB2_FULL_39_7]OFZ10718.1 MAG: hypothetical protein A2465_05130 [Bacteroidetes bacterium RIFOXYC2_FULL_39_11]HCT93217.1 hypothetical protein [Rikenellaceae bacterium]
MFKKSFFIYSGIIVIILFTALSGCGVSSRSRQNNMSQWERDYRRDYNNRLSYNERRINELKDSRHRERIYVIETRNNNMKKRLDSFKGNSRNEWDSFKREFNRDMRKVEKSIKSFTKSNNNRNNSDRNNKKR